MNTAKIEEFVALLNKEFGICFSKYGIVYSFEEKRKYFKILINTNQKSVYCFVDKITGDIYKAASFETPAKGVRGNIAISPLNICQTYGIK